MPKTAWPTVAELTNELDAYGVTLPSEYGSAELTDILDEVTADIETRTGFIPFLKAASADHYYDPPSIAPGQGYSLFFRGGFTGVSALVVGVTTDYAGTSLTVNQDYWLKPIGAPDRNRPYTYIEFHQPPLGGMRSIKVTGTAGFSENLPVDIWRAHLRESARRVMTIPGLMTASATEIKQGPVTYKFDSAVAKDIRMAFEEAINKYRLWP